MNDLSEDEIVHEMLFGPLPDLVVSPKPASPPIEVVTAVRYFRQRPYKQVWMVNEGLDVPGGDLHAPVIDWCEGPYRGQRR